MSARFFAVVFVVVASVAGAAPPPDFAASVTRWLGDAPHGVAAAWVDGEGASFATAGKLSRTDDRPITPDTLFEIGSITKVFTGVLLADGVAQGRVRLDDPVGAPFAPSAVTYRQLVTHTAGLPRMPAMPAGEPRGPVRLEVLQAAFAAAAEKAGPGPSSYSNLGFAVLGHALAQAAWGSAYADAVRGRVLEPLGLRDTYLDWRTVDAARLAPGHNPGGPAANLDFRAEAPAGALVSTARDLALFLQANLGLRDTPVNALLAETHRPLAEAQGQNRQMGHAWIIEKRGAATIIWHNGGTAGYRSFLAFDPERKVGVALLANDNSRGLEALGFTLLEGRSP
jgi:D-alanyl-D-alanine-carboxypeptidase/D-alanyl-D-alanine-endopeptidase